MTTYGDNVLDYDAKADFQAGVVRITANEYETALAVATAHALST
jgi:hypothetical protein